MILYLAHSYAEFSRTGNHNKVARAFNHSSRVQTWMSPLKGMFLIKASEGTTKRDIVDLITGTRNEAFVVPFDPDNYDYSIPQSASDRVQEWLQRVAPKV